MCVCVYARVRVCFVIVLFVNVLLLFSLSCVFCFFFSVVFLFSFHPPFFQSDSRNTILKENENTNGTNGY